MDDSPPTSSDSLLDLFDQATAIPAEARAAFLDVQCAGNEALRAELDALLAADDHAGQFLAEPTVADHRAPFLNAPTTVEELPRRIGAYKLLQLVGEGGFGTVYLAEQEHPVRRRVALKIIKLGMDTKQVIARFEAERQAVAMMDHPNIAKVFDAGATDSGRPYFVMELVNGVPITQYCDENRLTTSQRLELFTDVCHAVQHAHQKGIIHRDIKPNNVLITLHDGRPVPKVIDFGVAKATGLPLTDKTLFTELRTMIGTPEYMSPEQAEMSGLDVDTRSDVYSLGVLLYELLTGATPLDARDLRSKAFVEMQRAIREVEPPRPSTRLSTVKSIVSIAAQRGVEPQKLHALIRGDLDWIVMKCLEKDRSRRYESASALADDVQNYLDDKPVAATPPRAVYRFRKFVRRHRLGMAVGIAIFLALSAGLVIALIGFDRARRDRDLAVAARNAEADARAYEHETDRFLIDMFDSLDPAQSRGKEVSVREVLESASKNIDANPPTHPLAEASLRYTFGIAFFRLGKIDQAAKELERALSLERAWNSDHNAGVAHVLSQLGDVYSTRGQLELAEKTFRESLAIHRTVFGRNDAQTMTVQTNLSNVLNDRNELDEADQLLAEVVSYQHTHQVAPMDRVVAENALADLRMRRGKPVEAVELQRAAFKLASDANGADGGDTLIMENNLAEKLRVIGEMDEAATHGEHVLTTARRVYGIDHLQTLRFANNHALQLASLGKIDESAALLADTVDRMKKTIGEDNPRTLMSRDDAALLLLSRNRLDEALAESRDVVERLRKSGVATSPGTIRAESQFAWTLAKTGKFSEAEAIMREQLPHAREILGSHNSGMFAFLNRFGFVLMEQGKLSEAEPILEQACDGESSLGLLEIQPQVSLNYGVCLSREKKLEQALPILLAAEERLEKARDADAHAGKQRAIAALIDTYQQLGKQSEAESWRQRGAATQPTTSSAK